MRILPGCRPFAAGAGRLPHSALCLGYCGDGALESSLLCLQDSAAARRRAWFTRRRGCAEQLELAGAKVNLLGSPKQSFERFVIRALRGGQWGYYSAAGRRIKAYKLQKVSIPADNKIDHTAPRTRFHGRYPAVRVIWAEIYLFRLVWHKDRCRSACGHRGGKTAHSSRYRQKVVASRQRIYKKNFTPIIAIIGRL